MNKEIQSELTIQLKVDSLLAKMTLDEKIGQMTQVRHFDDITEEDIAKRYIGSIIHTQGPLPGDTPKEWQAKFNALQRKALSTRLGIPLIFGVDAIHGQNTYEGATIFPHNIGMGATGNAELVKEAARITAIESRATGFNWVFSPCIAIPYNEKWGRVYEAFSESTQLTQELAKASVLGLQGESLDVPTSVMATAKHFIGDGATDYGHEGGEAHMEMDDVRERLLPPYITAVDQGVGAVMASFNSLNGIPMHAHKELITGILKGEMGFEGIVVSDWKGYSRFGENAVINAGVDMIMAVEGDFEMYQEGLKRGVESGEVPMSRIDDAVSRILYKKFEMGVFDQPFATGELILKIGSEAHRNVAKQAVRESLVLLKNNNILPLDPSHKKIVVVGEHANNSGLQSGGWTVNWQGSTESYKGASTILDGINNIAKGTLVYDENATGSDFDADVAIIVVGETPYAESFGDIGGEMNLYQLHLKEEHQRYVDHYANQGVKTIVVLVSGRPLVTTKQIQQSDAFVAAWLPGSEGDAVAEVLFGKYNFKGKLPHSWPKSEEDYQGKYGPNLWDETITPLFPFWFGLTY